ncbi:DUF3817 domain-containing protein [Taibaiella chishuiensis]|uniref:Integral membrane protein n=1 Tax=Taibaiella chishuiensis TaxID=1434707 RepID=A0A2P8D1S2_9BACT|nr:DUF3817 domain-containing protein [Taibaiella chishuiensis]PSK91116.1 integral membrane protein [Taibaiella chishuiensis]
MIAHLRSRIGRLRLIGLLEGSSLLLLLFVAVPMKYYWNDPMATRLLGPVHGVLFLLFIFNTLSVGVEQRWVFRRTTWKVLLACIIPFGTFYIDRRILARIKPQNDTL